MNSEKSVSATSFGVNTRWWWMLIGLLLPVILLVAVGFVNAADGEQAKVVAGDGAESDLFGASVSISGDSAVIGAWGDDDAGFISGSAYVFVRSGGDWVQQAKLIASDGAADDIFGASVSISENTIAIGAKSDNDTDIRTGSTYVFTRSCGVWSQEAKLTASDAAAHDFFGSFVSVNANTIVVGAVGDDDAGPSSGSAYVFVREGDTWIEEAKLTTLDATTRDNFGGSTSISGDTAVISANQSTTRPGAAYVFVRNGGVWSQQSKLMASDGASLDKFGNAVAVRGDTVVLGAEADVNAGAQSGSAYVFIRDGSTWNEQAKLTASDAAHFDEFGHSGAIAGATILISADLDDESGSDSGSVYVFAREGVIWSEVRKLSSNDAADNDELGRSVSMSGDTIIVGAWGDDDSGSESGSAYIFASAPSVPEAPLIVATFDGDSQATVDWNAPASDGGTAIAHYTVTSEPGGFIGTTTANSIVATPLTNGVPYAFVITATNAIGTGPPSVRTKVVTPSGNTVSVSGTLTLQAVGSESNLALIGPTITLIPTGGGASIVIVVASDGSFAINDVEAGVHTIEANASGFLLAQYQNFTVPTSSIVVQTLQLRGGDANGDGVVSIRDISTIAASFGATPGDRLDGSGRVVDILDISNAVSNFGAVAPLRW
jgi:hypothetical protein